MRLSRPAMLLASRMSPAFIINPQKPELIIIDMSHLFHFSGLVGYFSAWCCIDPYARQSDVALNFRLPYLQQVVDVSLNALSTPLLGQESLALWTMLIFKPTMLSLVTLATFFFLMLWWTTFHNIKTSWLLSMIHRFWTCSPNLHRRLVHLEIKKAD